MWLDGSVPNPRLPGIEEPALVNAACQQMESSRSHCCDRDLDMHAPPLFSVIVPLAFHRDKWESCLDAWCRTQTLSRALYEVIVVVPPVFPTAALAQVAARLGPQDRLERLDASHDVALCARGALISRGKYLFFTEAHCWPEPDALERCFQLLGEHVDWSAFSGRTVPVTHNRLSEAESEFYGAEIEYGMLVHPWRKILDQCFVTRREAYFKNGGFEFELGHTAEWVLAANYFASGDRIGYAPEVRVHHFNSGRLAELREFTLDFVDGEM